MEMVRFCGGAFWETQFKAEASNDVTFFLLALLLHRGELLVTCGDKRGTLDPDKLAKGTTLCACHYNIILIIIQRLAEIKTRV